MNKVIRTSAFIAASAGLALSAGTLSAGTLANAPDRSDFTFPGELTGLTESVGVDTIVSDAVPTTVAALNIYTGHAQQSHTGKATKQGERARRSANKDDTA